MAKTKFEAIFLFEFRDDTTEANVLAYMKELAGDEMLSTGELVEVVSVGRVK